MKTRAIDYRHYFPSKQEGHLYIHEIEILTENPMHMKLHAIMLHNTPFHIPNMSPMRTSFATLDIFRDNLRHAVCTLKEALPRFTMVEADISADKLTLLPEMKENGIPRTFGELIGIDLAIMKCRA